MTDYGFELIRPQLARSRLGFDVGSVDRFHMKYVAGSRVARVYVDRGPGVIEIALSTLVWIDGDRETPVDTVDRAAIIPRLMAGIRALGGECLVMDERTRPIDPIAEGFAIQRVDADTLEYRDGVRTVHVRSERSPDGGIWVSDDDLRLVTDSGESALPEAERQFIVDRIRDRIRRGERW